MTYTFITREVNLAILLEKAKKLLFSEGEDAELSILKRKILIDDIEHIPDYPVKLESAIELFTPTPKSLYYVHHHRKEYFVKNKIVAISDFKSFDTSLGFENYVSNFYKKSENTYGFEYFEKKKLFEEYNRSPFIGKICAELLLTDWASGNGFNGLHKQLIDLSVLFEEKLGIRIEYVFPPNSYFIQHMEERINSDHESGEDYTNWYHEHIG